MRKYFLLTIIFVACLCAKAQNIQVKSFVDLPNDMTAISMKWKRMDSNGKPAALIKIVTTETGFSFEGGRLGIVDVLEQTGEVWVWVPYGLRKITIRHPQYGALENFYMPFDIESERTYEMVLLVTKDGDSRVGSKKGAVSVTSNLAAQFYIDDQLIGSTPMYYADLSCGSHTVKVVKEGYDDYVETINVDEDDVVMVKAQLGVRQEVKILCNVPDADLYIDGNKVGKASDTYRLRYGEYSVRATAPSHEPFSGKIIVNQLTSNYSIYLISGEEFTVNGVSFTMKKVDGGSFGMGSKDEYSDQDESPVHTVSLDGFYLGETEVTQALWEAVMKDNPSHFVGDNLPVTNVSWMECQRFISSLNKLTNRHFRLPTEAEWEYAARGGTSTSLYSGENLSVINDNNAPNLDPLAWYAGNCGRNYTQQEGCDVARGVDISKISGLQYPDRIGGAHPVGKKKPNAYGLYDMLGNVAEWCNDAYGQYSITTVHNPQGPGMGTRHVARGGGFNFKAQYCRVSARSYETEKQAFLGFRLALSQETQKKSGANQIEGALKGKFSVSDGKQVRFSQGNLQYNAQNKRWCFADKQYDIIGGNNKWVSPNYNGWIDLFCWGTSGYPHGAIISDPFGKGVIDGIGNYHPSASQFYAYGDAKSNLNDKTGKADWGYNPIANGGNEENCGWRTLTGEEWTYLLNTRNTKSGIRYAKARVNEVNGVILLPDDWDRSCYKLKKTNKENAKYDENVIDAYEWIGLEECGAVFLPVAGIRVYNFNGRMNEIAVAHVNACGFYWSASCAGRDDAVCLKINNSSLSTGKGEGRYNACSVRLVFPAN